MRTLYTPNGPAAYHKTMHVAAHLSMRGTPTAKRYSVWFVPTGGVGRGLAESDPRHKAAVKRALEAGPLNGARAEWAEENGDTYTVQEA
ncbi:hypothetical protein [Armatimonas rosea]|uniref:Uncharacterized protein n=1 Tax=Armatimonas rosea TaxID=685828 RepID=A0A7W9W9H9_ARMRO|nr:hypothetical protein [Armatimonas rosea]MBB6053311.1 hypothetical protein [Armatimonas rosea]